MRQLMRTIGLQAFTVARSFPFLGINTTVMPLPFLVLVRIVLLPLRKAVRYLKTFWASFVFCSNFRSLYEILSPPGVDVLLVLARNLLRQATNSSFSICSPFSVLRGGGGSSWWPLKLWSMTAFTLSSSVTHRLSHIDYHTHTHAHTSPPASLSPSEQVSHTNKSPQGKRKKGKEKKKREGGKKIEKNKNKKNRSATASLTHPSDPAASHSFKSSQISHSQVAIRPRSQTCGRHNALRLVQV